MTTLEGYGRGCRLTHRCVDGVLDVESSYFGEGGEGLIGLGEVSVEVSGTVQGRFPFCWILVDVSTRTFTQESFSLSFVTEARSWV